MKFQSASFLVGAFAAVAVMSTRARLRPVVVELGALALQLARLGRTLFERQIENAEDVWAEVEERARLHDRRGRARARHEGAAAHG